MPMDSLIPALWSDLGIWSSSTQVIMAFQRKKSVSSLRILFFQMPAGTIVSKSGTHFSAWELSREENNHDRCEIETTCLAASTLTIFGVILANKEKGIIFRLCVPM